MVRLHGWTLYVQSLTVNCGKSNAGAKWIYCPVVPQSICQWRMEQIIQQIMEIDEWLCEKKCAKYGKIYFSTIPWIHRPKIWQIYHTLYDMMAAVPLSGLLKMACKPTLISFIFCYFFPRLQNSRSYKVPCSGKSLMSETGVTVLSVTISEKSCFPQHISVCCKRTARQLNALARISIYLNINSHRAVYNNFIMSNLNYFPLVWHFCGQVNYQTFEKIQEKGLRIKNKLLFAGMGVPIIAGEGKRFNIPSDDRGSRPDDLSVSV